MTAAAQRSTRAHPRIPFQLPIARFAHYPMSIPSPISPLLEAADASFLPYGDPPAGHDAPVMLPEVISELELEYAAVRKTAALLDQPQRAVLVVTGSDRVDFLNRMITQDVKAIPPHVWRSSFWLNRKGRIDADLRVIALPDRIVLDMDIHALARTKQGLDAYIITEDVALTDATQDVHRLALHGPRSLDILASVVAQTESPGSQAPALRALKPGEVTTVSFQGSLITVAREDATGDIGLELFVPVAAARPLYEALLSLAHDHPRSPDPASRPVAPALRPIGWHAFNIARIEGGTPLYNLDFGPNSLPHETGILYSRVSFKKGCYLGQEIVARMESRGHSKAVLVALRCDGPDARDADGTPRQPVTGAQLFPVSDAMGEQIGTVTSSTVSPILSSTPISFAMVKQAHAAPGTTLLVTADGAQIHATIQPKLAFWSRS